MIEFTVGAYKMQNSSTIAHDKNINNYQFIQSKILFYISINCTKWYNVKYLCIWSSYVSWKTMKKGSKNAHIENYEVQGFVYSFWIFVEITTKVYIMIDYHDEDWSLLLRAVSVFRVFCSHFSTIWANNDGFWVYN